MAETKIFEILDEAKELEGKIAQYKNVADQEMVIVWMDNILKLVTKLGKAEEELQASRARDYKEVGGRPAYQP